MKKATHATDRSTLRDFRQIMNVGPAMAGDFRRMKLDSPQALIGRDPLALYAELCQVDRTFHDPCVLDTLIAVVAYMDGAPPLAWWSYTVERKRRFGPQVEALRAQFGA
ncbi:MAG: mitomycin resistance protein [Planctomycetes bacterium]|nr:mitomycin resistance protein [Planctomycetota bacterium]MCB9909099.1 mitomycin resistance protein [Planctomycetota bacterium]MCB9911651.1 mitomycin resistance protein [Planctomycetota bacterium]HPF14361.1 helix-hairpin-helix domain-containing protein [Planctomycetota bacterium]HRV81037.1 helix-hairpin-helix domain-containing protein [Planctomycetota bacterium]